MSCNCQLTWRCQSCHSRRMRGVVCLSTGWWRLGRRRFAGDAGRGRGNHRQRRKITESTVRPNLSHLPTSHMPTNTATVIITTLLGFSVFNPDFTYSVNEKWNLRCTILECFVESSKDGMFSDYAMMWGLRC